MARHLTHLLQEFSWEVFNHPPYSPDLAPSDFYLFLHLKKFLSGQCQRFQNDREAEMSVTVVPIPCGRLLRHRDTKIGSIQIRRRGMFNAGVVLLLDNDQRSTHLLLEFS